MNFRIIKVMIQLIMLISTTNILQSIQSSSKVDNSGNKDVSKESIKNKQASTILDSMPKEFKNQTQSKTVQDMVQNVLKQLSSKTTSNQSALNSLKNSSVLQDLGTLSKDIQPLTTLIKDEPKLSKYEPVLNQFMTSVKDLDAKTLESKIKQTGIFLESKLLNQAKTTKIAQPLKQILTDIKNELIKLDIPQTKPILSKLEQIQTNIKDTPKVLQQDIKDIATSIKQINPQDISSQIKQSVLKLDNLATKLEQTVQTLPKEVANKTAEPKKLDIQLKDILVQIKDTIKQIPTLQNSTALNKTIDTILVKNQNTTPQAQQQIENEDIKVPANIIKEAKVVLQDAIKVLNNIKQPIQDFTQQVKSSNENAITKQQITQIDSKVQTMIKDITVKLEQNIQPKQIQSLQTDIKEVLTQVKQNPTIRAVLQNINPTFTSTIQTIIDQPKITIQNELNNMNTNSFTQNIKQIVTMLKQNINNMEQNNSNQNSTQSLPLMQLANKLDTMISQPLQNSLLLTPTNQENTKQIISNDMKAVLLQLKDDASSVDTPQSKDIIKHVDKMIGQIEYFQALSYANATQSTFLPFIWDSMEEGEISFKKLKEDKFFVQINLKLKEYGKLDLMVILHDENQLDISIFAQKDEFKKIVQENMQQLKQAINKADLIPVNIRLLDIQKDEDIKNETNSFVNDQQIGQGISIRV